MSRPNQVPSPGRARDSCRIASVGSVLVNRLGKVAMSTNTRIMTELIQKSGLRRMARQASPASERGGPASTGFSPRDVASGASVTADSVMGDPRVEQAVDEVDDDQHCRRPDHRDPVPRADGAEDVAADPGDVEDALGDDRAAEE